VTEEDINTTYGSRANLSRRSAQSIIDAFSVSDAFLPDFIGRPDYWAPYVVHDEALSTYEFHCQHPRWQRPSKWDQHRFVQRAPSSIYMKHFGDQNFTLYLVAAAPNDDCITFLRDRLTVSDVDVLRPRLQSFVNGHPFLLHSIISSVVVEQSKEYVHHVRKTLMAQINEVNDYGKPASERLTPKGATDRNETSQMDYSGGDNDAGRQGRAKLTAITKDLHIVSQMADTGISNAEKAIENCEYILKEYYHFRARFPGRSNDHNMESSMRYSLNVWVCQKRLLVSYKARKETSMNLVREPLSSHAPS
jgi:hypothetical protein